MLRYKCICCTREYKRELCKKQLITNGICGIRCRESFDLWLALPPVLRGRLSDWHREREKTKGAA